jgi:NACalpha-BTF3-like transcription factor|mmetsp:Transcript_7882/g.14348  ORF Transcript_7882/g.14348 Transcript_7882/m.14348 type:complete len:100 (+) Transcript_7882:57-356(+)
MATDQEQAKQLDSVTDVVQEKELDQNKAQEAMASLAGAAKSQSTKTTPTLQVSKEDVTLIMTQMEVSEDEAIRALQETAVVMAEGKSLPVETLRRMVTS